MSVILYWFPNDVILRMNTLQLLRAAASSQFNKKLIIILTEWYIFYLYSNWVCNCPSKVAIMVHNVKRLYYKHMIIMCNLYNFSLGTHYTFVFTAGWFSARNFAILALGSVVKSLFPHLLVGATGRTVSIYSRLWWHNHSQLCLGCKLFALWQCCSWLHSNVFHIN